MMNVICPDDEILQDLLLGRLENDQFEQYRKHFSTCASCAKRAGAMRPSDELVAALKYPRSDEYDSNAISSIVENGKSLFSDTTQKQAGSNADRPDIDEDARFDFLDPALEDDEIGRLECYRILRILGRGGMGFVFLAEDTSLRRQVAIKVMAPRFESDKQARIRFLREAQAMASISSDYVGTIHRVAEHNHLPFIVMPVLIGESLASKLKREKRLSAEDLCWIAKDVAKGISVIHEQGLIHRDLKPSNIWLESTVRRAKILDFGLAQVDDNASLTASGAIIGTPQYMSPEQATGDSIDYRSDLFSLGSVMYHMAAGQPPFVTKNTTSTLIAVAQVDCLPLEQTCPGLDRWLAKLISRLLERDPDDRPNNAVEVMDAIVRSSELPTDSALPHIDTKTMSRTSTSPRRPASRKRRPMTGVGLAAVATILFAIIAVKFFNRPGTIVVELPDDVNVEDVQIDGNSVPFKQAENPAKVIVNAEPGRHRLKLTTDEGNTLTTELDPHPLLVKAGDTLLLKSWLETPADNIRAPVSTAVSQDYERGFAKSVVSDGGMVIIHQGNGIQWKASTIDKVAQLPVEPFRLHAITLIGQQQSVKVLNRNPNQLEHLEVISIIDSVLTDQELEKLSGFLNLRIIVFDNSQVSEAGLRHLNKLTNLRLLKFIKTPITTVGVSHLLGASQLDHLSLSEQDVQDEMLQIIAKLGRLKKLALFSTKVTARGMNAIGEMNQLEELTLQGTILTDSMLVPLRHLSGLEKLNLSGTTVSEDSIASLQGFLPNCRILYPTDSSRELAKMVLFLGGSLLLTNYEDYFEVKEFDDLPNQDFNIFKVDFSGNQELSVDDITFLAQCETLEVLKLVRTTLDDSLMPLLKRFKKLHNLDLSQTQITDSGLASLKDLPLKILHFTGTQVSDDGVEHLARHPTLTTLFLQYTKIGNDGLMHLASIPNLECLVVGNNSVSDDGLRYLQASKSLDELQLTNTEITDAGLEQLEPISSLRQLTLHDTKVTREGVETLRRKLPHCTIHWNGGKVQPHSE